MIRRTVLFTAPAKAAAIAVLALVLGGCSTIEAMFGQDVPPPACPNVAVLPDAKDIVKFRPGQGRDLIDILYESELTNLSQSCVYDIDENTGEGTLTVEIGVFIDIARGPANRDRKAEFAYFIVITDQSKKVLNKQRFPVKVAFPGNLSRLTWADDPDAPAIVLIPLKGGKIGRDFNIFVGFQLSPEELEFNRRRSASQRL